MLLKFINIPIFILSLAIGFFFVYVYAPDSRTVYVFPTPGNVNDIQFKDSTGNCYYYNQDTVECPINSADIAIIPPQV